ncbi:MAG: hypothetical protein RRA32_07115, partial [bacterium]|nr:hypothetical protein [bacterium]
MCPEEVICQCRCIGDGSGYELVKIGIKHFVIEEVLTGPSIQVPEFVVEIDERISCQFERVIVFKLAVRH